MDISDALLVELRQRAAVSGRPFRKELEETLQRGLAGKSQIAKPARVKTYPVGIKSAYRGVSLNQLYDQLETESQIKAGER